jgi:diketogulonate reductase-like aldo/keto reductase
MAKRSKYTRGRGDEGAEGALNYDNENASREAQPLRGAMAKRSKYTRGEVAKQLRSAYKMTTRQFGTLPRFIPVIGQGTWNLPTRGADLERAKAALRRGIELGAVHIDTAEMYGSGQAEEAIAESIKGLPRRELFLVSKVLPSNASYAGTIKACESSLRRLRTEYLDCYLLHWRGSIPLGDTLGALEKLVEDGKILSLGVSNFDVDDLVEAAHHLKKHQIACNQVLYNLAERGIERKLLPYCSEQNIALVGYTPFGQIPSRGKNADVITDIARKHKATIHQVVLAFLTRLPGTFAIPKSAKVEHTEENIQADGLTLTPQEIEEIDKLFPVPKRDAPLATG